MLSREILFVTDDHENESDEYDEWGIEEDEWGLTMS